MAAIADHFFEEQALHVDLLPGKDNEEAIARVTADEATIGIVSAPSFIKARADGAPIIAFASAFVSSTVELTTLSDTRILTAADLEGKRIAYRGGLEVYTTVREIIGKNALRQSGIQLFETDTPASDLLTSAADVIVGYKDVEERSLRTSGLTFRSISPAAFGVQAMGPLYIANEGAFRNRKVLEGFLTAVARGWQAVYSDPGRPVRWLDQLAQQESDPSEIARMMSTQRRFLRPYGAKFGEFDSRRLQAAQAQLLRQRIIERAIDLDRATNYAILREVHRRSSVNLFQDEP